MTAPSPVIARSVSDAAIQKQRCSLDCFAFARNDGVLTAAAPERRVGAVARQQFLMPAALHEPAAAENEDAVEGDDVLEAVGDEDHGAIDCDASNQVVDGRGRRRIERGRCFVEDEHRRIANERARDRNALPLSAREAGAAFARDGVVSGRAERGGVELG